MSSTYIKTVDGFYKKANELRKHFDGVFADPRRSNPERFKWDYWHVPNQYTLLRTPSWEFFAQKQFEPLFKEIRQWGRDHLGTLEISPPWMSCYVDGCEQKLHSDMPHGPFAFVYSLTNWKQRKFSGGETKILNGTVLEFWNEPRDAEFHEESQIFHKVEPVFNRLTVFDPRVPHGVETVRGVHDVREGRLVIHGWFTQPRPWIDGPLPQDRLERLLATLNEGVEEILGNGGFVTGLLTFRLKVGLSGNITEFKVIANTLRGPDHEFQKEMVGEMAKFLKAIDFGKQKAPSVVTIPLMFA